jgi:D-alanyl-D-alanine dipeptidase
MSKLPIFSFLTLSLLLPTAVFSQDSPLPRPEPISVPAAYLDKVSKDSTMKLVELKTLIPHLVYDIRYATTNNFTGRRMYPAGTKTCFLRLPAARALQRVETKLNKQGMGLKIYDGYRPYAVTVKFWELIGDERYVAHPAKGSGHNRGIAVDLTIINLSDGKELNMGTDYDDFRENAHHAFTNLPAEVIANRKLLKDLMLEEGFILFDTEWWHYSLPDPKHYDLMDLPFKKIPKN